MPDSTFVMVAYWVGFAVALYMTLVWRQFMMRKVWRAGSAMQLDKVTAYQMALMTGGVTRVALTGLVRLLARKVLVAGIAGVVSENGAVHETLDAVESQALQTARKPSLFRDLLVRLQIQLEREGTSRQLRAELVAMGYMRTWGSPDWWANYARNMLPFALLLGAVLLGMAEPAMTADARALPGFSLWAGVTMLVVALPMRVTALGRYIVWSATKHHPDFKTARATQGEAIDIKTLGQSVALYGEDALAGSDMAWIPAVLAHVGNSD
jgi:uncharacterized protein (TIGR04222 family)